MVPFLRAVDGLEVARGAEDEVAAVSAEDGISGVVPAVGDGVLLFVGNAIDVDDVVLVIGHAGVGQPAAVGREGDVGRLLARILHHLGHGLRSHVDEADAVLAVGVDDPTAVRTPREVADIRVVVFRQLNRVATLGGLHPQLRFAGGVGDVSDVFAVGRPGAAAVVCAGRTGEVFRHALLYGQVEDFAAGRGHDPFAVRREASAAQVLAAVLDGTAGVNIVRRQRDLHLLGPLRGRVEAVDVAAILEDDQPAVGGGELDVVVLEVGHLLRLLGRRVVDKDVHRAVTVREEVDLVAHPHGEDVLGVVVGHVLHGFLVRVVDPDVVGHAAFVILPRAELTHHAVVSQTSAVGRVAAKAALGQGDRLGESAVTTDGEESAAEAVADAVAIDDARAVRGPGHDDVVRPHAVAEVVAGVGRGVGQAHRLAAVGGDGVDLRVAVVLAGEGDRAAVGREARKHFIARVRRQPSGLAARSGHFV